MTKIRATADPAREAVTTVGPVSSFEGTPQIETCDVCIVGAGLAGLNALFVASQYLSQDQKVVLVDRRERVGGMWVDTYPYVRLHQPHRMFTAGNIPWTLRRDRSHLATKAEVLDHLEHCLNVIKKRVRVDEYFGWGLESHDASGGNVRITCRSADGHLLIVEAKRLIKAYGVRVVPNDPLQISSARVHSISPDFCDMRGPEMRASNAPVWVIGGGKTAMDTAHTLITEYPGREVNIVTGSGTLFTNRDQFFPNGTRRWWGGELGSSIGAEVARRFDGTNETEVADWFRTRYGLWLTPATGNFLLGWLSESENTTITLGLKDIVMNHFVDAVDRGATTELVFRSGPTKTVAPGSWIVNCTGYFMHLDYPYEPYVSANGAVLSIQPRSATMHLTSFGAYYLTHLLFLGKLTDVPLYELDIQALWSRSHFASSFTILLLAQYNLSLIFDEIPLTTFGDFRLDLDRWYPLPRRVISTVRFLRTHRRDREHLRRSLDVVRERFDIRCGPLSG